MVTYLGIPHLKTPSWYPIRSAQVGSESHPLRSLQVACDRAVTFGSDTPMVLLRGGTHFLTESVMLGPLTETGRVVCGGVPFFFRNP